jgi:Spy/CpxP family protein refolding chaperone
MDEIRKKSAAKNLQILLSAAILAAAFGFTVPASAQQSGGDETEARAGEGERHRKGRHMHRREKMREKWKSMSEEEKLEAIDRRITRRVERMDKELDLTDEQEKKIKSIMDARVAEIRDARQRHTDDREAMRKEIRSIFEKGRADIEKLLTPDQKKTFAEMIEKRRQRKKGRFERRMRRVMRQLDLTDEQKGKVRTIFSEAKKKHRALRESDADDRRAKMRALRSSTREEIRQVLTEEQRAELDEIIEKHRGRRGRRGAK